ncbi:hypothetical protein LCGC14_2052650 [marine sediment metagenome]|uniref:Uncharacterized protein n=1 Tax=marine sediment metagenome TaxID=412755 RepID=A0A0F9HKK8_9ZZZZ
MPRISSDQRMNDVKLAMEEYHASFTKYMEARRAYDMCIKHVKMRVISITVGNERFPKLLEARTKTADVLRQKWITFKKYMRMANEGKAF